jgi:hypothetical protein
LEFLARRAKMSKLLLSCPSHGGSHTNAPLHRNTTRWMEFEFCKLILEPHITFLSSVGRALFPFQESRALNRKNTHSLVTSPSLTQIELKSFPGIVGRHLLVFIDMAFYRIGSIPPLFKNVMSCVVLHQKGDLMWSTLIRDSTLI